MPKHPNVAASSPAPLPENVRRLQRALGWAASSKFSQQVFMSAADRLLPEHYEHVLNGLEETVAPAFRDAAYNYCATPLDEFVRHQRRVYGRERTPSELVGLIDWLTPPVQLLLDLVHRSRVSRQRPS